MTRSVERLAGACILAALAVFLFSSQLRCIDNDEYEHLHKAWMMQQGTIRWFDIQFTHTPLLEWLTQPFLRLVGESEAIIRVMRLAMFSLSCGSLAMAMVVVRRLTGSELQARLEVLLIAGNLAWIRKSPEIRPDNLMVFFCLWSFLALLRFEDTRRYRYLAGAAAASLFAVLGKQNAAAFVVPAAAVFVFDAVLRRRVVPAWLALAGVLAAGAAGLSSPVQDFLARNFRHFFSGDTPRLPLGFAVVPALVFNPLVFVMFAASVGVRGPGRAYLVAVPVFALGMLLVMNRPFMQEMLLMVVFMAMAGAAAAERVLRRAGPRRAPVLVLLLAAPVFAYMPAFAVRENMTADVRTTRDILRMSEPSDPVFDAYGKAIFRHSPLEPGFLVYRPRVFDRLDQLKAGDPRFVIWDARYLARLPAPARRWIEERFRPSPENPDILVRADDRALE